MSKVLSTIGITGKIGQANVILINNCQQFCWALLGANLVDRIGRRPLLLFSNIGCCLVWLAMTVSTAIYQMSTPEHGTYGTNSVAGVVCTVQMTGQKSVQVQYTGVSSVTIVPSTLTVAPGAGVQIPAIANGYGTCTYTVPGSNPPQQQTTACQGSPVIWGTPFLANGATGTGAGTVSSTGYYTPASSDPASAVEVQVTSAVSQNVMATVTINNQ